MTFQCEHPTASRGIPEIRKICAADGLGVCRGPGRLNRQRAPPSMPALWIYNLFFLLFALLERRQASPQRTGAKG